MLSGLCAMCLSKARADSSLFRGLHEKLGFSQNSLNFPDEYCGRLSALMLEGISCLLNCALYSFYFTVAALTLELVYFDEL